MVSDDMLFAFARICIWGSIILGVFYFLLRIFG
jgi:hypothetical protein